MAVIRPGTGYLCKNESITNTPGHSNVLCTFCMFTNDHKDIMSIDLGATNKFLQKREFANTKSANNDGKL